MKSLLLAVQFLTRLPLPQVTSDDPRAFGRSMLWYPLVGLLIGMMLWGGMLLLVNVPAMLSAALLLIAWVLITGALHLDGLADSADAWLGGYGDRERTLAIMKDPYCGPAAVVVLLCVLLGKFAALHAIVSSANGLALVLAPVLARVALPALFLTTPYVRQHGLGSQLAAYLPRRSAWLIGLASLLLIGLLGGSGAVWAMLGAGLMWVWLRWLMRKRLGGATGDTAGAMVELIELTVLVVLVCQ